MQRPNSEAVTLADILITEALSHRVSRAPDLQAENQAMRSLIHQMAQDSEALLQSLVDTALALCAAGTTGVSLLETTPDGAEIFRWTALAGTLAHQVGGSTPRDFSPCGVCLDQGSPVLFSHPERYFTYFQEANTPVVEGLVVPLITDSHVFGTIWIMSHDEQRHFDSEDVRVMTSLADFTATALLLQQRQTGELLAANVALEAEIVVAEHREAERKQSEVALRESEARLQAIANLVPDLLWDSEPDGSTNWYNQRWLEYTGQTFEQAIGWGWTDAIHPDDQEGSARRYREAVEQGMPLQQEHRIRRHDGAYRWFVVKAAPLKDESGKVIKMYGAATDIHEQRVALEAALRESEAKYRTLFETIDEGFSIIEVLPDEHGRVTDLIYREGNRFFERQSGLHDVMGKRASEVLPNLEQELLDVMTRVYQTGESVRSEVFIADIDRWFTFQYSRVGDAGSPFIAAVFDNITDRKQRELSTALLDEIGKDLSILSAPDEIMQTVGKRLCEFLELSGCYFVDVDEAKNEVTVHYGWTSEQLPSLMQTFKLEDYLSEDFLRTMRAGALFVMRDTAQDERAEAQSYARLKVGSFVTVPFFRNGRYIGHIAVTTEQTHDWQPQEIQLLQEISSRIFPRIERARVEEALRQSEERLRLAIAATRLGLFDWDLTTDLVTVNAQFREILGLGEGSDVIGTDMLGHVVHPDDRDFVNGQIGAALDPHSDGSYEFEHRAITPQGERWLLTFGQVYFVGEGADRRAVRIIGNDLDITERKQSEQALIASEAKYRTLFETMSQGYAECEIIRDDAGNAIDYRLHRLNPAFERLSGVAIASAIGRTAREVFPDVDEHWISLFDRVVRSGEAEHVENELTSLRRWYEMHAYPAGGDNFTAIYEDITDRKHREQRQAFLLKLSDMLRAEMDADAVATLAVRLLAQELRLDRCYVVARRRGEDLWDIGAEFRLSLLPPMPPVLDQRDFPGSLRIITDQTLVFNNTADLPGLTDLESRGLQALGFGSLLMAVLRDGERNPGWSMVAVSVEPRQWTASEIALVEETAERTWAAVERARAEANLREAEVQRVREQSEREKERQRAEALADLDRAKTAFFSNVSHEFRTPLTLSLAPLQDALDDRTHPLDPVQRERLELVHRNNLRLLKLVNTLLDFSRIEAGRRSAVYEPTDLATYTAELASVFRSAIERAGLQLFVDCPPLPEPVFVDREMWEKIVLNLLSNAFKFTFEGEIRVSLHSADSNQVILQIQDTGAGIAPEHLPHLFERFYQVRGNQARTHEGSGIGLALVNELVRLQGGTIEVSSTLEEGTCFTITLPFGTDHLPSDRLQSEGDRYPVRTLASTAMGTTAYVEEAEQWLPTQNNQDQTIENSKEQATQIADSSLPNHTSARVLVVDDNTDMREYLTRILSEYVQVEAVTDGATALAAAQKQVPDLIVSDVMMPGLNGFELLEALRADPRTREIPIILLSARAGEEAIVEGLQAGADDYLIKPFSAQELVSRVTAHLQMAQQRGEALQEARSTLRSRDEFISVVSHELNTPLVSILGWTRMLRSSPPNPVMLSKALDTIERNATLQAKLVQDLLDLSRISAGKLRLNPQSIELKPVIETAIATVTQFAAEREVNLTWHATATEPVVVMGDSDRLSQVLINLLTNAIKFTPESGSVTLELSVVNHDGFADASYAEMRVTDTGIGIAADFLPQVFERFRQAERANSAKGLGLGLAISRHIVELHNGTIHAQSAGEGQGATFAVRLPLLQDGGS